MPGANQPSLITDCNPGQLTLEFRVSDNGRYFTAIATTHEPHGRHRRSRIPLVPFDAECLSAPDWARDLVTSWLYHPPTEVHRYVVRLAGKLDNLDHIG